MKMRFQQTADSTISYLRSFSSLNWRKTTAILLCLILALGNIPTNAAALSDQVLDSIVGSGLGESEVKTSSVESDAKAASTEELSENESEPVLSGQDEVLSDKPPQQDVIIEDASASEENEPLTNDSHETEESDSEYPNVESIE